MNYQTHKLNSQTHSHIIGRQDSVTGDIITENNEVVFCSACQSVFLVESWEYMNQKHCNQTETLDFVPLQEKKIKATKNNSLIFDTYPKGGFSKTIIISRNSIFFSIIGFGGIGYFIFDYFDLEKQNLIILIAILVFLALLFVFLMSVIINGVKTEYDNTILLQLHQDKLILFDKIYNWSEIAAIRYRAKPISTSAFVRPIFSSTVQFYVHKSSEKNNLDLKMGYPDNVKLLTSLMEISKFTEVSFYTEDQKEYQFLENKKRELQLNIILSIKN